MYTRNETRNISIITAILSLLLCLGRVCPASSEQPVITFNNNGGWCWFQDERVIVLNDMLVIGSVANRLGTGGAERGGNVEVTTLDLAGGSQPVTTILHTKFQNDDHDAPALLALPDERILAIYATHGSDERIHCRISSHPADGTTWQRERQVARRARVTYSNLFLLTSESDDVGRIYNFYRGEHWNPNWIFSDDQGESWQYGGRLIAFEGRPYAKYASNSRDTIHVIATEHHPHNYPNSIYHAYLKNGKLHKSNGTVICGVNEGPIEPNQATKVFAGDKDHVAWMCDVHLDRNDHPFIAYSVQKQLDPNHIRYHYARWDGRTWNDHFLAHAGTALYKGEEHYSGLVALDPADPNKLYISTDADPTTGAPLISDADQQRHYEIFAGQTHDEGTTWKWRPITKDSDVDNLRPIVPIGCGSRNVLLWLRGTYRSYTEYDLDVVGIVAEKLTGERVRNLRFDRRTP